VNNKPSLGLKKETGQGETPDELLGYNHMPVGALLHPAFLTELPYICRLNNFIFLILHTQ